MPFLTLTLVFTASFWMSMMSRMEFIKVDPLRWLVNKVKRPQ